MSYQQQVLAVQVLAVQVLAVQVLAVEAERVPAKRSCGASAGCAGREGMTKRKACFKQPKPWLADVEAEGVLPAQVETDRW